MFHQSEMKRIRFPFGDIKQFRNNDKAKQRSFFDFYTFSSNKIYLEFISAASATNDENNVSKLYFPLVRMCPELSEALISDVLKTNKRDVPWLVLYIFFF